MGRRRAFFPPAMDPRKTYVKPKKKNGGFMKLPGELRNRVYRFYFQEAFRVELAAQSDPLTWNKKPVVKFWPMVLSPPSGDSKIPAEDENARSARTLRMSRRLGRYKRVHGISTNWSKSLCALILVCKEIHRDTIAFLYSNTTFATAASSRMLNLTSVVPRRNLSYITKLELYYTTYGPPVFPDLVRFQGKQMESWTRTCKAISKKLVNLQLLHIWLTVHDVPLVFDLRQKWLLPLWQFRRLARRKEIQSPTKLTNIEIHFRTRYLGDITNPPELKQANTDIHRLFGKAIREAILGASETEAMMAFEEAWNGKYRRWREHLQYYKATW